MWNADGRRDLSSWTWPEPRLTLTRQRGFASPVNFTFCLFQPTCKHFNCCAHQADLFSLQQSTRFLVLNFSQTSACFSNSVLQSKSSQGAVTSQPHLLPIPDPLSLAQVSNYEDCENEKTRGKRAHQQTASRNFREMNVIWKRYITWA